MSLGPFVVSRADAQERLDLESRGGGGLHNSPRWLVQFLQYLQTPLVLIPNRARYCIIT